jgi:streptomycin 6-kinase
MDDNLNPHNQRFYDKSWLEDLPNLINKISLKYQLSHLKPLPNSRYNYVLSGFMQDMPIILKLSLDKSSITRESVALKAFANYGVTKIIVESEGMMIIGRVIPGTSLESYFPNQDAEAVKIVCNVMRKLHQAPIHSGLPNIKDSLALLQGNGDYMLQKARKISDTLLATSEKQVLLHGDLHHGNILQNGNDWIVIDPKGLIGEPAYEVAAFIRNPIHKLLDHEDPSALICSRIKLFSEILDVDAERIKGWCFVQLVLAWIWALEDRAYDDAKYFKTLMGLALAT